MELRAGQTVSLPTIVVGQYFSAALTSNEDLYCWGNNVYGQVGNGTTITQATPVKVLEHVISISVSDTMAALTSNGDLYCWGSNKYGQVGNGTTTNQTTPTKVLEHVTSISASSTLSSAITSNGDLYCWGENRHGRIGNGTMTNQTTPVKVLENVISVSIFGTLAAITSNRDLYCWGYNEYGQVGNGTTASQTTPVKVLENVTSVSISFDQGFLSTTLAAITGNRDLYCWGNNSQGCVGNGTMTNQTTPIKVLEDVTSITSVSGYRHMRMWAAITGNGDLYCWGDNSHGQIGNGTTTTQRTPIKVLEKVTSVSISDHNQWGRTLAAITNTGDLYCWGDNSYGQVGNNTTTNQTTPVKVLEDVVSVSVAASDMLAAIASNGDLYCWGDNSYGQVGNGATRIQTTPVKVLEDVISVSGFSTLSAITSNGDLYRWGENYRGQVGNGTMKNQKIPIKVLENITSISSFSGTWAAIASNGDLYCWGENSFGQVGNGIITQITEVQKTPVKVMNLMTNSQMPSPGDIASFSLPKTASGTFSGKNITISGEIHLKESQMAGNEQWEQIINSITWTSSDPSITGKVRCSLDLGDTETSSNKKFMVSFTPKSVGTATITGTFPSGLTQSCTVVVEEKTNNEGATDIDSSQITVNVRDYATLIDGEIEGAKVEIEDIGEATTDAEGNAYIVNLLSEPSGMKRISVTKEGYRDYVFYTTIVHPQNVTPFATNQFFLSLTKKKTGDDMNPYVSSVVYYRNELAQHCGGQHFVKSDTITFRICGVWNNKKPGYYCIYQSGGKSFESKDGIFKLNIGEFFSGNNGIYAKMIAEDGTESEPERVFITVPEGDSGVIENSDYISILNERSESDRQKDVPFLNDDKLSFDLGKIKTTIKRDGSKIRIMLGAEPSADIFNDEAWSDWKKFCKSQPTDLTLSQWSNVVKSDNLDTSWTAGAKVKATGYGWLENDMAADSTTPLTGGIQIAIDMSTAFKQQYVVGVVPVYMEESLGVNGRFEGSVTFDTNTRKLGGSTKLTVTPSLSVGGGLGVLYAVTIGAEGSASMPMVINFPKGLTQADLKGALSIKASVLGFNYSKELAEKTYPLYNAEESSQSKASFAKDSVSLYDMKQYTLPDTIVPETEWYGGQTEQLAKSSASSPNLTEKLLQTGTSELTDPMLIQDGDTTLAVFLTEDASRDIIHRTKLVYTVYDKSNGQWSVPAEVDEDGTGDFYPYLTASNGKIAVSWLNYMDTVTDSSSMQEALQSSEICYAIWDKNAQNFQKTSEVLRSSSAFSYNNARLHIDTEGEITEVGIKNTAKDIFGISGDNILFMTGKCGKISVNQEFPLSQGMPVSYDITASGNVITAAVCMDTDRDLTTLADREIYLFSSDGNINRLTENDTLDSAPQYAEFQGKDALFWYTENGYQVLETSGNQSVVLGEENTNISESFTVVSGKGNKTALVWSSVDENQVYQLAACLYDAASGKWSKQVMLSDSSESIFRPSGYFNTSGDMEFIYRKGDTTKAGSLYTLQVIQAPDLQIVNAYIEDGTEIPGETTKVFVGVRNLGTKEVTQYNISVDGQITPSTVRILPGESALVEANYTVPKTAKNREISIEIAMQEDSDTSNNMFKLMAGYADVSVATTEDEWENGRIVHVSVTNDEAVPTDAVLEVHKDTIDGELVSSLELGTLKQGDLVTTKFIYPKGTSGYEVDASALYYVVTSSTNEKYESNNYDYSVFSELENESGNESEGNESPTTPPQPSQKLTQTLNLKYGLNFKRTIGSKFKQRVTGANTEVTFTSSDPDVVKVNKTSGKITCVKVGEAVITAEAAESDEYKAASTQVTITVIPKKAGIQFVVSNRKGQAIVKSTNKAKGNTGYQIQYKNNGETKSLRVKSRKAITKVIKGLKSGKSLKVRIRAYKRVNGKTYFGNYSSWKTLKRVR